MARAVTDSARPGKPFSAQWLCSAVSPRHGFAPPARFDLARAGSAACLAEGTTATTVTYGGIGFL
jgi:hypothetical protein